MVNKDYHMPPQGAVLLNMVSLLPSLLMFAAFLVLFVIVFFFFFVLSFFLMNKDVYIYIISANKNIPDNAMKSRRYRICKLIEQAFFLPHLTPQLSLVISVPPRGGMDRLSWPGVAGYLPKCFTGLQTVTVHPPKY